jgi:DNA-binding CsgD family transcriptional regulator
MNRKIFIIHSSEIVRKGLAVILRNYFNHEIFLLENIEALNEHYELKGQNIILIVEESLLTASNPAQPFEKYNQSKIIIFRNSRLHSSAPLPFCDESMDLNTSSLKVQEIISSCWKIRQHPFKKKASEELTTREKDVLRLVALGHTNKAIAEKLFISIHTVISHRKNITDKTGIKSISGLTVYAILNNLIDTDTINPENLI